VRWSYLALGCILFGKYRVFYDVEEQVKIVAIQAVGFKIGNELYIRGERREL